MKYSKSSYIIHILSFLIFGYLLISASARGLPWQISVLIAALYFAILGLMFGLSRRVADTDLKQTIDLGLSSSLITPDETIVTMAFDIANMRGGQVYILGFPRSKERSENTLVLTSHRLLFLFALPPIFGMPVGGSLTDTVVAAAGKTLVKDKPLSELLTYAVFQIPYTDVANATLEWASLKLTTTQGKSYGYVLNSWTLIGHTKTFEDALKIHLGERLIVK